MSEQEMNSYRFGSGEEPSEEMLAQIMKEAASEAKEKGEKAMRAYFDELRTAAHKVESEIAERKKGMSNGKRES